MHTYIYTGPSDAPPPTRRYSTQYTCFTGTKLQILTLYWHKSTNTEGDWIHLHPQDVKHIRVDGVSICTFVPLKQVKQGAVRCTSTDKTSSQYLYFCSGKASFVLVKQLKQGAVGCTSTDKTSSIFQLMTLTALKMQNASPTPSELKRKRKKREAPSA